MFNYFKNKLQSIFSNILANYERRLLTMILCGGPVVNQEALNKAIDAALEAAPVISTGELVAATAVAATTSIIIAGFSGDIVTAAICFGTFVISCYTSHKLASAAAKSYFKKGYAAGSEANTVSENTALNTTDKVVDTVKTSATKTSDPLEQFDVVSVIKAIEWTNLSWILLLCLFIFGFWVWSFYYKTFTNYDFVLKSIFRLVKNILKENLYIKKQQYFSILFYLFIVILLCNMVGLIPYSFTVTSSFVVTFFLALMHFLGINLVAITEKKWEFQQLLLPGDSPLPIAPFLVFIEGVSYVARVFSLSIRLFANMMSGHALLKILIGFSWNLLTSGGLIAILALVPWTIVTIIMFLELLIAFLQAYVFVILVTIYINDVLNMH